MCEPLTANPPSTSARGIAVAFCVIVIFSGCITNTLTGLLEEVFYEMNTEQYHCPHTNIRWQIKKDNRLYAECLDCGLKDEADPVTAQSSYILLTKFYFKVSIFEYVIVQVDNFQNYLESY